MTTETGPPWTPERYYEIDHCLVRKCWRNSVIDITTDPHTNINTDHYMMTVGLKQTLKAKEDIQYEQSLKNITIPDGNEEEILKRFNNNISVHLTKTKTEQNRETTLADLCVAMSKAAREKPTTQRTTFKKKKLPPRTTTDH